MVLDTSTLVSAPLRRGCCLPGTGLGLLSPGADIQRRRPPGHASFSWRRPAHTGGVRAAPGRLKQTPFPADHRVGGPGRCSRRISRPGGSMGAGDIQCVLKRGMRAAPSRQSGGRQACRAAWTCCSTAVNRTMGGLTARHLPGTRADLQTTFHLVPLQRVRRSCAPSVPWTALQGLLPLPRIQNWANMQSTGYGVKAGAGIGLSGCRCQGDRCGCLPADLSPDD